MIVILVHDDFVYLQEASVGMMGHVTADSPLFVSGSSDDSLAVMKAWPT